MPSSFTTRPINPWQESWQNLIPLLIGTRPARHNNIKRLTGKLASRLRYRIGDWRVIYRVDDRARQVHVLLVAHRSEVYE